MNVMEFLLTLMVWGVLEDNPEPEQQQQNTSSEAQTDQPPLIVVEDSGDEAEKNEKKGVDVITPAFGLLTIMDDIAEDKMDEEQIEDESNIDTSEKILRITQDDKPLDWTAEPENPFREPTPPTATKQNEDFQLKRPTVSTSLRSKTNLPVPLIEYLCQLRNCSFKELHVLFHNLDARREIIEHLRQNVQLRTSHLKPTCRNFIVHCHDLTVQSASIVPAMSGYLGITVRGYYYVKHNFKLCHPYLPCIIEFGGGHHRSFYPLEVLCVIRNKMKGGCY
uniref:PAZ domain-containing protein n=1 Tax=Meloidogyne incognita TaxID=6306 RepID=A0A914NUD4_MELIC